MTRRTLCFTSTMICSSSPPSRTPTMIQCCSPVCFHARTNRFGRRPLTGRSDTLEWAGPGVQSRVRQTRISSAQSGSSGSSASRTAQSTSTRRDWSPAVPLKHMESITSTHTRLVAKMASFRAIRAIAMCYDWDIECFDFNGTYLNRTLNEEPPEYETQT